MKRPFLVFISMLFFLLESHAAPVRNLKTLVLQPDDTELSLYASGDEFFHRLHDENGYTIIAGGDGYYYYGIQSSDGKKIVPSIYRADQPVPLSAGILPNIGISTKAYAERMEYFKTYSTISLKEQSQTRSTHKGIINNIVIYISFKDQQTFLTKRSVYDARLNSMTNSAGSLKHYYDEVSYGQLDIQSYHFPATDDMGTVTTGYVDYRNRGFYRAYNATTNPEGYSSSTETVAREHSLVVNAIDALRSEIEQTLTAEEIDSDNDGYVDNICFVIQGRSDGWSDLLWAHRWSLYTRECYIHDKRVMDYVFQPENQVTTNTLCHEMFHALGAPDLYHYNDDAKYLDPVGNWDLMNNGWCHMGAYMKWKYSGQMWVTDMPQITASGRFNVVALAKGPENVCYKIASTSPDEYYVVEYRKKEGIYEKNIPRSGILVYLINTKVTEGNRNGPPDEVYIYRPYGTLESNGNIDEAAYPTTKGPVITNHTYPTPFLSNGEDGGLRLSNIEINGDIASFDIEIITTDIHEVEKEDVVVYADGYLIIKNAEGISQIEICNMQGIVVKTITDLSNQIPITDLSSGIYIMRVNTSLGEYIKKMIIK